MTTSIWFWGALVTGWALMVALGLLFLRGGTREPESVIDTSDAIPWEAGPWNYDDINAVIEANRITRTAWTGTPQ